MANTVTASSETASSTPWRSKIVPRRAGTSRSSTCWLTARSDSSPALTVESQVARTTARARRARKSAKSRPMRRSTSRKLAGARGGGRGWDRRRRCLGNDRGLRRGDRRGRRGRPRARAWSGRGGGAGVGAGAGVAVGVGAASSVLAGAFRLARARLALRAETSRKRTSPGEGSTRPRCSADFCTRSLEPRPRQLAPQPRVLARDCLRLLAGHGDAAVQAQQVDVEEHDARPAAGPPGRSRRGPAAARRARSRPARARRAARPRARRPASAAGAPGGERQRLRRGRCGPSGGLPGGELAAPPAGGPSAHAGCRPPRRRWVRRRGR